MSKDLSVVIKCLMKDIFSCVIFSIVNFSHENPLQSPTGGTSGLCFKKLNITTPTYRIIINRLDRKVNTV